MVKDIVVEEDLNPEVDKPGRRMKLDARNVSVEKEMPDIDWDKESVPLEPTPGTYCTHGTGQSARRKKKKQNCELNISCSHGQMFDRYTLNTLLGWQVKGRDM